MDATVISLDLSALDWLKSEAESAEWNPAELGRAFFRRLTSQEWSDWELVPALPHRGVDQIVQRLLAAPPSHYPHRDWLLWDLCEGRWQSSDFVAASGFCRTQLAEPAWVGRQDELAELLKLAEGLTLVVSPPGMGKTRLLLEAARHARAKGWLVLRAECRESSLQSFQPFQEVAAQIRLHPQLWSCMEARLGDWLPTVLRLYPILRPLSECPPEQSPAPEFLAESNLQATRALLASVGPAVWVFDDLQRAEARVLDCLSSLEGPIWGASHHRLELAQRVIELGPLHPEHLSELALSMCGPVECGELNDWSQGHPLLAKALLRSLCENGGMVRQAGVWERSELQPSWGSVSPSLERVLRERCQALSPPCRLALGQGALIGKSFEVKWLEQERPHLALQEAVQKGLVNPSDEQCYSFTHELIWKEMLKATTPPEKVDFHRKASERLLASPSPSPSQLSEHLWHSNQLESCLHWSVRAAREHQQSWEMKSAAFYWERVLHLCPEDAQSCFEWGCTLRYLGSFEAAREALQRALGLATESDLRVQCLARLGENAWRAGQLDEAESHFRRGLGELGYEVPRGAWRWLAILRELIPYPSGPARLSERQKLAARMLDQLAYTVVYRDGIGLIWANLRGLRLTAQSNSLERGMLLASHAVIVLFVPKLLARARRCIEEAARMVADDRLQLAGARARHGSILLFTGEIKAALSTSLSALKVLAQGGDLYDVRMVRYNVAHQYYWLGQLEPAKELALQGWREASAAGDWLSAAYNARVLTSLGVVPDNFRLHFGSPSPQPMVEALRQESLGLIELVRGRPEQASGYFEAALESSRRQKVCLDTAWRSGWLATAYRSAAELAPLAARRAFYQKGLKAAQESLGWAQAGYHSYYPHALRELAWCQLGLGQSGDGFERSLHWAEKMGMQLQADLTRSEMGRAGVSPALAQHFDFWQFRAPSQASRALGQRFEEALRQASQILCARDVSTVWVRAREAARALLGSLSCVLQTGTADGIYKLPETSDQGAKWVLPLGTHWGQELTLECSQAMGAKELPEESELASFLGSLLSLALHHAAMLEERSALFEAVPVGLASLDREGRILLANSALKQMLGSKIEGQLLKEYESRTGGIEGGYLGPDGHLLMADRRVAEWGPGRSVVSLSNINWGRLQQVAEFQEQERRLLGVEIHDASQPLVALAFQLSACELPEAAEQVRKVLNQLRSLMFEFRGATRDNFDLAESLRDLVSEVCGHAQLQSRLEIDPRASSVAGLSALFAYRMVGEGLSNLRRHAQASRLHLRLRCVQGQLWVSLVNDGPGKVGSSSARGVGLKGIAERAHLLGGWARFRRLPDGGGLLHFRLPLEISLG